MIGQARRPRPRRRRSTCLRANDQGPLADQMMGANGANGRVSEDSSRRKKAEPAERQTNEGLCVLGGRGEDQRAHHADRDPGGECRGIARRAKIKPRVKASGGTQAGESQECPAKPGPADVCGDDQGENEPGGVGRRGQCPNQQPAGRRGSRTKGNKIEPAVERKGDRGLVQAKGWVEGETGNLFVQHGNAARRRTTLTRTESSISPVTHDMERTG